MGELNFFEFLLNIYDFQYYSKYWKSKRKSKKFEKFKELGDIEIYDDDVVDNIKYIDELYLQKNFSKQEDIDNFRENVKFWKKANELLQSYKEGQEYEIALKNIYLIMMNRHNEKIMTKFMSSNFKKKDQVESLVLKIKEEVNG